ncbi:MAG TPA: NAD(P)H-hydrate dehydratase [Candidatus Acidoferrales bacterium]|nr:NAD(P)H-hydrate dehydratase [Candidatus Acidoferrales bacterium]
MEQLLTADEMRMCDSEAVEDGKVTSESLMNKASLGVAEVAARMLGDLQGKKIAVLCGTGNNGGDGFGASYYLAQKGAAVKVYVAGKTDEITGDARTFLDKLRLSPFDRSKIEIYEFESSVIYLNEFDLVIDAVLGTGLSGEPKDEAQKAIELMTKTLIPILAVDVPSGINSSNGAIYTSAAAATATATMAYVKRGLIMNEGKDNSGKVYVLDIGMPSTLVTLEKANTYVIECSDVRNLLPLRKAETYKHAVGKIFGLVGSVGMTGAGVMVGQAAMRAGAGSVVLGVPSELNQIFESKLTEVMTLPLPQTRDGSLSLAVLLQIQKNLQWADVLVVGPGLSRNQETSQLLVKLLRSHTGKTVIDADALDAIADQPEILMETHTDIIMTPHHGEFSQLSRLSPQEIAKNRIEVARRYAKERQVTLVLKGSPTVIASKDERVFVNVHGNPGMATAGMGDVLTGIIAALVGQKLEPLDAAIAGVYIHSVAGDIALESKGMYSLMATDVIESLPAAFKKIQDGDIVEFEKIS